MNVAFESKSTLAPAKENECNNASPARTTLLRYVPRALLAFLRIYPA